MILGIRKPAKLAGTPNFELSSFARRRSKFAEFPFIIVPLPLFRVLISVPQTPSPVKRARSFLPAWTILPLRLGSIRRLQQLRQWPPMPSPHLWHLSFPGDRTKPVDPY